MATDARGTNEAEITPGQVEATAGMAAKIHEVSMFTFGSWNWLLVARLLDSPTAQVDEGLMITSKAISIADKHRV